MVVSDAEEANIGTIDAIEVEMYMEESCNQAVLYHKFLYFCYIV